MRREREILIINVSALDVQEHRIARERVRAVAHDAAMTEAFSRLEHVELQIIAGAVGWRSEPVELVGDNDQGAHAGRGFVCLVQTIVGQRSAKG